MRSLAVVVIAGAFAMSTPPAAAQDSFAEALISAERSPDIPEEHDIYVPLLGVWQVRAIDRLDNGALHETLGEWHFARTLEGRAVQDVWIAPARPRAAPGPGLPNRYGTTVRTFDPASGRWRIVWFNPVSGALDTLTGRRENGAIIHEGVRPNGQRIRWIFPMLTADRFHWIGEAEQADVSWLREAEFFGERRH